MTLNRRVPASESGALFAAHIGCEPEHLDRLPERLVRLTERVRHFLVSRDRFGCEGVSVWMPYPFRDSVGVFVTPLSSCKDLRKKERKKGRKEEGRYEQAPVKGYKHTLTFHALKRHAFDFEAGIKLRP